VAETSGLARNQDAYDRFSAVVDVPLMVLAVVWLPVLVIPLAAKLSAPVTDAFTTVDYIVWAAFVVEYLVKLYLAPSRRHFISTHLVDLLVIVVPFLRPLRVARLFRLVRILRVAVVLGEVVTRAKAVLTHRGLHYVLLTVMILVLIGAGMVLGFEHNAPRSNIHDYGDALWWAMVTVTTVGYGDRYPVTAGGRGVAVVLMLVGIGLVGVLTATVASYFVEQRDQSRDTELDARLERIEQILESIVSDGRTSAAGNERSAEPS
jgi:voltage-gated potassium channel